MVSMTGAPECCWQESCKLEVIPMERVPPRLPLTITMLFLVSAQQNAKEKNAKNLPVSYVQKEANALISILLHTV